MGVGVSDRRPAPERVRVLVMALGTDRSEPPVTVTGDVAGRVGAARTGSVDGAVADAASMPTPDARFLTFRFSPGAPASEAGVEARTRRRCDALDGLGAVSLDGSVLVSVVLPVSMRGPPRVWALCPRAASALTKGICKVPLADPLPDGAGNSKGINGA